MTISARLWLSAAVSLAALLAFSAALALELRAARLADAARANARETVATAQRILSDLRDIETGERGFLVTGRDRYLVPYDVGKQLLPQAQAELHALTAAGDPELRGEAAKLGQIVAQKVADASRSVSERRAAKNYIVDFTEMDHGMRDMDSARAIVATIAAQKQTDLRRIGRDLERLRDQLLFSALFGAALVASIVFATTWLTVRAVRTRLDKLQAAIERLGRGEVTPGLSGMGSGELAQVGEAFNDMACRLATEAAVRAEAEDTVKRVNDSLVAKTRQLENYSATVNIVRRLADRLPGCADEAEFSTVIERLVPELLPGRAGALFLLNNSRNLLHRAASWNGNQSSADQFTPADCWGLRRGQTHASGAGQVDVSCEHITDPDSTTHWCLPLVAQSETVGLLYVESNGERISGDPDGDVMHMLAETVALALVNLRLREKLRSQSVRDPLTGLYNRRYLDESLELELARSARSENPVSVVMLDIDHFKIFNDTFGHEAGDVVLKHVADVFGKATRKGDVAGRFGGEEFLLMMPGADLRQAVDRAEKVREAIRSIDAVFGGQKLGQITASFGVATFPGSAQTAGELIEEADKALYAAKDAGRDRVVAAAVYAGVDAR